MLKPHVRVHVHRRPGKTDIQIMKALNAVTRDGDDEILLTGYNNTAVRFRLATDLTLTSN